MREARQARKIGLAGCFFAAALVLPLAQPLSRPLHGIAMHGETDLSPGFSYLPYVNPEAPKGGMVRLGVAGAFDSTNPFILNGNPAGGVSQFVFESLMTRSRDEAFSLYGLIAESVELNEERTRAAFRLRAQARFSDGMPITAQDVLFSLKTLRENGRPNHRDYYAQVIDASAPDDRTVVFELPGDNRELAFNLALMPILPRHIFAERDFTQTTLKPLIGSGPYVMSDIKPGISITFRRNRDYWAKNLPISRGRWNFDIIRYEYFRDVQAAWEAFKAGLIDLRFEDDPGRWVSGYETLGSSGIAPVQLSIKSGRPRPARGLVFNTRRAVFADKRVRRALIEAFDFEWANRNLFYGQFQRIQGYFDGSSLSAIGRPAGPRERALLARYQADVPEDILNGHFRQPVSDGSGRDRNRLRAAIAKFKQAGWSQRKGILQRDVQGFAFEFMIQNRAYERIALHYQRSLRKLGVAMDVRLVDSAQFQSRIRSYDFDMIPFTLRNSLSPGNEQRFRWMSDKRDIPGSFNFAGAENSAIDGLIGELLQSRDKADFIAAARALDRLLIAGAYVMPLYGPKRQWVAHWPHVAFPEKMPLYGFSIDSLGTGWAVADPP